MGKSMPHPWLIRFKFSVAIALPSMSLLWLALPTRAVENPHQQLSKTAPLTKPAHDALEAVATGQPVASRWDEEVAEDQEVNQETLVADDAPTNGADHPSEPLLEVSPPFLERFASTPAKSFTSRLPGALRGFNSTLQVELPTMNALFSAPHSIAWGTPLREADERLGGLAAPSLSAAPTSVESTSVPLSNSPQRMESLPSEVLFSQSELAVPVEYSEAATLSPFSGQLPTYDIELAAPLEDLFSQLDPEEPTESAEPTESEEPTESAEPTELDTPADLDLPPESETPAESEDTVEPSDDGTFSPLPEPDPEEDAEPSPSSGDEPAQPAAPSAEDEADEPPTGTGEATPIPVDRVVDDLEFLDPDPNPLLIQTQPEEVEIIGTQPITLEEAIELAYRNSPDLQVSLLQLEQSQAALRAAQAALFPTLSVTGTIQGQEANNIDPLGGVIEQFGVSLSGQIDLNYELYTSGGRAASIRAAEEQVRFEELDIELIQEGLRLNTATQYYNLQSAIESIRINQAFLEEAERNLRDTRLREEVGVGTRFDVLRAEVQAADARQDLVNSQRDSRVAERTLVSLLNLPPSIAITPVPVEVAGNWPLGLEESIVLAYQNRAELEQQLVLRDLNEQQRRQALSVLGPRVDLFATYTYNDIITENDFDGDNYQVGAQVSWTLFEGGAARANARQEELAIEIAERDFENARNDIRLAVEDAFFNLESNLINIDTARLSVEQAQEALDLAILRFDAGVGTQLEILDAQSDLTDAEVNLIQAIVGYNISLAEMERATSNIAEAYYEDLPF